jgi:hypothetical protein
VITYRKDFWTLIKDIKDKGDKIAEFLLKLDATDINIPQNVISLSDNNNTINIISDTRKSKYSLISTDYIYREHRSLVNAGFVRPRGDFPPANTEGNILDVTPYPNNRPYMIARFKIANGDIWNVDPRGLDEIPPKPTSITIGRFVVKILTAAKIEHTAKDIEDFVNAFKSEYDIKHKDVLKDFYLVSGEDIRKYYNEVTYERPVKGQIWSSCMRYEKCQSFLDIYVNNPDKIQLLVLMDSRDKVRGRALVWKLDKPEIIFMDRIYAKNDNDINLFKTYAKKNDWIYKSEQCNDITAIYNREKILNIKLDNFKFDSYPYMDTLCYMTVDGLLHNDKELKSYCKMRGIQGQEYSCAECESTGYRYCDSCDGDGCERCDNSGRERCKYCSNIDREF